MNYITYILESLKEMMVGVMNFVPTFINLLTALAVLVIGWLLARGITKVIVTALRALNIDKHSDKIGLSKTLKKGGVKTKPSSLVGCIAYWVMMVMVLMTTVKAFGFTLAVDFLDKLFAFIPHVVIGALTLIVGMLIAKAVATLVYITAKNTDMPIPETLRDLSQLAIVIYVTIMYLKEIGLVGLFGGINYTLFIGGIIFALALAFGLAGRDVAARYLEVFKKAK